MCVRVVRAARECLEGSPYRRADVADVRRAPEEGCVLMTKIYNISKAKLLGGRNKDGTYMGRMRVTKVASHRAQGVHLHL